MPATTINDLRDALGLGLGVVTRIWEYKTKGWITSVPWQILTMTVMSKWLPVRATVGYFYYPKKGIADGNANSERGLGLEPQWPAISRQRGEIAMLASLLEREMVRSISLTRMARLSPKMVEPLLSIRMVRPPSGRSERSLLV